MNLLAKTQLMCMVVLSSACPCTPGAAAALGAPPGSGAQSVFPKCPPPARRLLHADLMKAPDDVRLALTVLQGLVNREQPRIYLTQDPGWHGPALIPLWIEGLKQRGHTFVAVPDPLSLFETFRSQVKGAVFYEDGLDAQPEALHKLNAITLYCALNDAVPVTQALNARLHLPVLLDMRGKLGTAREAYQWAYDELWPHANHRALALTCPSHIVLRDYLVAHRIMPFWISQGMDEEAEKVCLRFLDEAEPNAPLMGCWGGYGEKPAGRVSEPRLQQLASERGKLVVVSDGCFNLTVHSGLAFRRPAARPVRPLPALDPGKVYLCFCFTDGDNLQYVQQYFPSRQWWGDPNRGKLPLAWSLGPTAAELMPDVMEYLLRTRTPNDEFVCPTAGVGLIVPSTYGQATGRRREVYDRYLQLTDAGMRRAGLTALHLGNTSGVPIAMADFSEWALKLPALSGILADYGPAPGVTPTNAAFSTARGVPVLRTLTAPGSSAPNAQSAPALAEAIRQATPPSRPAAMHVCLINWFNSPTVALEAMRLLGPDYVAVLPSQLFPLLRPARRTAIRFEFASGSEGWQAANDLRDLVVRDGALCAVTAGPDPYLLRTNLAVPAGSIRQVVLRLKVGPGGGDGQLFFTTDSAPDWGEQQSIRFRVTTDGAWHDYALPVAGSPDWRGTITGIRIDPTCLRSGVPIALDAVRAE